MILSGRIQSSVMAYITARPVQPKVLDRSDVILRVVSRSRECLSKRPRILILTWAEGIGDKKSDILAGQAAGCTTILVLTGAAGAGEAELAAIRDYVAHGLLDAALIIRSAEFCIAETVG